MIRLTSAFFVSAICGLFSVQAQDGALARTPKIQSSQNPDGSFPRAEQSSPNADPDLNVTAFPPTPMEERTAKLRVPPVGSQENQATVGMVSVHELRYPLSEEKAQELNAANQQILKGNADAGVKRLTLALDDPACAGYANAMLGTEYLKRGDLSRATEHLQEAVRLLPGLQPARANLGYALALAGHRKVSISELRKALALKVDDPRPNYLLGLLLLSDESAAAEAENKLRVASSVVPAARLGLAILKDRAGDSAGVLQEVAPFGPELKNAAMEFVHGAAAMKYPAAAFGLPHSVGD